jgi:hypothetical protein
MSRKQYVDFIESTGMKHIKFNARSWGSYELCLSYDERHWFNDGEVFGWGYSTHDAAIAIFEKYSHPHPNYPNFVALMGPHLDRLKEIIKNPEPEPEPLLVEPLKLISQGSDV